LQSLAGRFAVLLAAALIAAGLAAGTLYLATVADTSVADELLPPGEYDTIEEAQRAAGFNIPHARDLGGWRLQSIAVSGPEYGIIGEGEDADIHNLRIASLTYRREVGERRPGSPRTSKRRCRAAGSGRRPAERTTIAGHDAQFQLNHHEGGTFSNVFVQWVGNGLLITAHAVLITPIEVSGRVVEHGLTLEQFLTLLNSFE
jgi:hypothetical protein